MRSPGFLHLLDDPRLDRDAGDMHAAISDLIRVYQFRERDRISRHDLSVTQFYALEALEAAGTLSLNELAARLFLDKSTTSRVVDALERKQLARREANPADRRALRLGLTAVGAQLVSRVRGEIVSEEKRLLNDFEPAVRKEMLRLLGRLTRAVTARIDTSGGTCSTIA